MSIPAVGGNLTVSGYTSVRCTGNPNQDAQNFAQANNISIEEAKQILSSQFGAPSAPRAQQAQAPDSAGTVKIVTDSQDEEYGVAMSINIDGYVPVQATGNPDVDLQNFANANGISSLDEAKQIISGALGAPSKPADKKDVSKSDDTAETDDTSADNEEEVEELSAYDQWYNGLSNTQKTALEKLESAKSKLDDATEQWKTQQTKYAKKVAEYWLKMQMGAYQNCINAGIKKNDLKTYCSEMLLK